MNARAAEFDKEFQTSDNRYVHSQFMGPPSPTKGGVEGIPRWEARDEIEGMTVISMMWCLLGFKLGWGFSFVRL